MVMCRSCRERHFKYSSSVSIIHLRFASIYANFYSMCHMNVVESWGQSRITNANASDISEDSSH